MVATPRKLSCPSCAAPVTFVPDETVLVCSYCGTASSLTDGTGAPVVVSVHRLVPNRMRQEALEAALGLFLDARWLAPRNLSSSLKVAAVDGRYLPYWVVEAEADTRWTGVVRLPRHRDDESFETRTEPRDGIFHSSHFWPVYGRRREELWGQDALKPGGLRVRPDWGSFPLPLFGFERTGPHNLAADALAFDMDRVGPDLPLMHGQLVHEEAEREARQEIELHCWTRARAGVETLQQCDTSVSIKETALAHVPFWWFTWTFQGRPYQALFHGGTGELLAVSYPVAGWPKLLVTIIVTALLAGLLLATLPDPAWRTAVLALSCGFLAFCTLHFLDEGDASETNEEQGGADDEGDDGAGAD